LRFELTRQSTRISQFAKYCTLLRKNGKREHFVGSKFRHVVRRWFTGDHQASDVTRRSSTLLVTGKAGQYINCVPLRSPLDTRFHQKPPTFRSEGIWRWSPRRRPADAPPRPVGPGPRPGMTMKHSLPAGVTFDGRLPSIRHFRDGRAIRTEG